jgi:uncharacterized protein
MRIVVDANVFVSAVLQPRSNPGRVIELVREGKVKLLLSPAILSEIRTTLLYPKLRKLHHRSAKWIDAFLAEFLKNAESTPGHLHVDAIKNDPSDNMYLASALEGFADCIVSGDHHLTDLKVFRGIRIVNPSTFLRILADEGGA